MGRKFQINLDDEISLFDDVEHDLEQQYEEEYYFDHPDEKPVVVSDGACNLSPLYPTDSELNAKQYLNLFADPYHRFMPHQPLMGHALINTQAENPIAQQFNPPVTNAYGVQYTQINNIRLFEYQGQKMALGEAEDGTQMIARRSIQVKFKDKDKDKDKDKNKSEYDLLLFSPLHDGSGRKKHLGQHKAAPFLKSSVTTSEQQLIDTLDEMPAQHKGGKVTVDKVSIQYRETHKRRPTQKRVMGRKSAQQIMLSFYQDYQDILSPSMKTLMEYAIFTGRNEWTHALGHRLCPLSRNPQTRDNLVAGPFWLNSKMNVTEKFIVHHTKHGQNKKTRLKCILDTLPGGDVIDRGFIKAKVSQGKRKVTIRQELDAWVKYPIYSHVTDIPQTVLVSQALLEGHKPYCVAATHLGKITSYDDLDVFGISESQNNADSSDSDDLSDVDVLKNELKQIRI